MSKLTLYYDKDANPAILKGRAYLHDLLKAYANE